MPGYAGAGGRWRRFSEALSQVRRAGIGGVGRKLVKWERGRKGGGVVYGERAGGQAARWRRARGEA